MCSRSPMGASAASRSFPTTSGWRCNSEPSGSRARRTILIRPRHGRTAQGGLLEIGVRRLPRSHSCGPRPPARWSPKPTPSRLPERSTSSLACRDARAAEGPLALGGAPSGVEAVGRRPGRLGPRRFLLRDRRRRAATPVRPAGAAGRARGARGQPRDRGRAHQRLARTRRPRPRRAARRAGVRATAGRPRPTGRAAIRGRRSAAGRHRGAPGTEPPFDLMLWVESRRAIVIGDSLIDNGTGLTLFDRWIPEGQTREQVLERLRPLLELPVEIVLPTHGAPTDRAALERALT